jgi:hypothetical protein
VAAIIQDEGFQRLAAFQSGGPPLPSGVLLSKLTAAPAEMFALYWPKVYDHAAEVVNAIHGANPGVQRSFNRSVYPAATLNLGLNTVCNGHWDDTNKPEAPCAITNFGEHTGADLFLKEFNLRVRFPSGSTILIPSACVMHGNTPIGAGEVRYSFTQYCVGGLFRWVRHGSRPAGTLTKEERLRLDGAPNARLRECVARLSFASELRADRAWLYGREKARLESQRAAAAWS